MSRGLQTPLGRSMVGVVAVLALAISLGRPHAVGDAATDGELIVLVSGRDDHGLEVADELPLHGGPGGAPIGTVPADTLAVVHETRGSWLRISAVEGTPRAVGWIDEFLVRGELHVVLPDAPACGVPTTVGGLQPSARVRVTDLHMLVDGTVEVGVTPVTGEHEHHVERDWVRELPGPAPVAGGNCAWVPDIAEATHRH